MSLEFNLVKAIICAGYFGYLSIQVSKSSDKILIFFIFLTACRLSRRQSIQI